MVNNEFSVYWRMSRILCIKLFLAYTAYSASPLLLLKQGIEYAALCFSCQPMTPVLCAHTTPRLSGVTRSISWRSNHAGNDVLLLGVRVSSKYHVSLYLFFRMVPCSMASTWTSWPFNLVPRAMTRTSSPLVMSSGMLHLASTCSPEHISMVIGTPGLLLSDIDDGLLDLIDISRRIRFRKH